MPVSKLKNLAILILLLANIALLGLLIPRHVQQHRQAQNLRSSLAQLCAEQNVVLDADTVPDTVTLYALELADREAAETAALSALLGHNDQETDGARTPGGWDSGVLELQLQNQKEVSDMRSAARKTLKRMGFQLYTLGQPERLSPGIYAVTAQQSVLGVPVYSQGLTLTYSNSSLSKLSGEFFTGTLARTGDNVCISATEAVVAFLAARVDLGWVGSAITQLEQGYLPADAASVRLTPVWKLSTDTGSFFVNGLTEEVTSIN